MATGNQDMGFRKNYKITGKPGYAGGPGSSRRSRANFGSNRCGQHCPEC
jgi:hypothetical protein